MVLTLEKLRRRVPEISAAAIRDTILLDDVQTCPADLHAGPVAAPPGDDDPAWMPIAPGDVWGHHANAQAPPPALLPWGVAPEGGSTHWLRASLRIPKEWRGRHVLLALDWQGSGQASLEALVYLHGQELAGFDEFHRAMLLPDNAHSGQHTLLLRCHLPHPQTFGGMKLCLRDESIFQFGQTMQTLLGVLETYTESDPARHRLLARLNEAYNRLDLREGWQSEAFASSAHLSLSLLRRDTAYEPQSGQQPTLLATGHAHLDVAWLWPLWRTRQKAIHTVATALHLMERYPDYHFSMSQPQVYTWLKQDAPILYEHLKQRIAEGRFEPVGMMWVEADCNLPSGESLVRQLLHGARFFAEEFGTMNHVVWLPDAFGYSAALPQLLRGCGITCFLTTKLSWNQTNRMPADTFRWRGIDGSDVLAHMVSAPSDDANAAHASIPQYTYVGKMTAAQVAGTWQHYRQQAINDELLYIYGWGDGGGGPTEEMLEAAQVLQQVPGMPQVQPGRVEQFFERLYERVWNHPDLPVWVGELYLEYHRGTYTSQAQVKQANRQAELLYRELEWLNAWAVTLGAQDRQSDLNVAWETILLNQFHDILPGSSIGRVYRDAAFDEHFVNDTADRVGRDIEQVLFPGANAAHPWPTYVLNSLPWERHDTLAWPLPSDKAPPRLLGQDGQVVLTQIVSLPDNRQHLLVDVSTPSYGYTRLHTQPAPEASEAPPLVSAPLRVTDNSLSNAWLRLELDANGEISSLYDIEHQRAIIASKQTGNQLVTYEDRPLDWDAWDIDPFYEEKAYPVQHILAWQVVEQGPIRAAIEITRQVGQSTIRQRICMWHNKRRIDFVTWVDWQERQTLLRALFPLQINASIATCEIQFGAIERPTHRNTSWEAARFEVCAHRWVDLGESGYGVALLNDGKYGHSFHHNVIGLSLLKGATFPDPDADRGNHQFTYSLLPHAGDWRSAQVVRRAYELNAPLHAVGAASAPTQPDSFSFLSTPAAHVVVETIKVAEDGNGLIVRLYEAHNQRGPVRLVFAQPVASAVETDLLEREIRPVEIDGHEIRCHVRPFEVKTLRVWLSAG